MKQAHILKYITVDPKTRFGKPHIKGTRVPVELVVGKIAGGMKTEEIMKEFDLTQEQVLSTLKYAAELISSEEISIQ